MTTPTPTQPPLPPVLPAGARVPVAWISAAAYVARLRAREAGA